MAVRFEVAAAVLWRGRGARRTYMQTRIRRPHPGAKALATPRIPFAKIDPPMPDAPLEEWPAFRDDLIGSGLEHIDADVRNADEWIAWITAGRPKSAH
jgi:hypothetical protein